MKKVWKPSEITIIEVIASEAITLSGDLMPETGEDGGTIDGENWW